MADHPSTYKAEKTHHEGVEWNDRASLHHADDGQGLLDGFKGLRNGTLATLVRQVAAMPPEERRQYVIQKAGDQKLDETAIMALAARQDFPR